MKLQNDVIQALENYMGHIFDDIDTNKKHGSRDGAACCARELRTVKKLTKLLKACKISQPKVVMQ